MTSRVRFCPRCQSTDIELYAGGQTGAYRCKKCGYVGPLILEKDIILTSKDNKK
ncbi:hypothetical protein JW868_01480 [Candidatus Woesearchaeota archaeon]|nr:hypothetical protein [Candidatus Woesearchaeota archaeon]